MFARRGWIALVGVALLVGACSKPPQAELDAAKSALGGAEAAGAAEYASDAWSSAQQAMNAAEAEIAAQNEKFALFRSYTKAKELVAAGDAAARAAEQAANEGKERARQEAQAGHDAVMAAIANAETLMAELEGCRRKPKGFKEDMEVMKGTLDGLKATAGEIANMIAGGSYLQATSQVAGLQSQVDTLVTDLQNAKTKIGC